MKRTRRLDTLHRALANLRFEEAPPAHLIAAAIALNRQPADHEVFHLLAAATEESHQGLVCKSASGLWTLEIFAGQSPEDLAARKGQVLLSVDSDHRATYEGRSARVFVMTPDGECVLAAAAVKDGEMFAEISLAGLDLLRRDAVNVTFGPMVSP